MYNTITGGTNSLVSNTTAAEAQHGDAVLTFNSADIQIAGTDTGGLNGDTNSMVLWNWKAGGAASTIAAGSIDGTNPTIASSVSANPTAGFSIVSYTGNATAGATVGHGLSSAPDMIILKDRDAINSWRVYSSEIPNTQHLILNDTNALVTGTHWNNTTATSSVFSLGSNDAVNGARGFIAYCFHSIEGYSKVGSYEGNGNADGSFIYLGFKPEFFLVKDIDAVESWAMWDGTREPYNKLSKKLSPNSPVAEYTANTTTYAIDFLSNGVKLRSSYSVLNASQTYIYYAIAKSPFKTSNAR